MALFNRKRKNLARALSPPSVRHQNGVSSSLIDQARGALTTTLDADESPLLGWLDQAREIVVQSQNRNLAQVLAPEATPPSITDRIKEKIRARLPLTMSAARRQQLEEMLSEEEKQRIRFIRKKVRQNIAVASVSLGFATAGLIYWPLGLLSVPGLILVPMPFYQQAYQLLKQRKVGVATLFTLSAIGCVVFGFFWVSSLARFGHPNGLQHGLTDHRRFTQQADQRLQTIA